MKTDKEILERSIIIKQMLSEHKNQREIGDYFGEEAKTISMFCVKHKIVAAHYRQVCEPFPKFKRSSVEEVDAWFDRNLIFNQSELAAAAKVSVGIIYWRRRRRKGGAKGKFTVKAKDVFALPADRISSLIAARGQDQLGHANKLLMGAF